MSILAGQLFKEASYILFSQALTGSMSKSANIIWDSLEVFHVRQEKRNTSPLIFIAMQVDRRNSLKESLTNEASTLNRKWTSCVYMSHSFSFIWSFLKNFLTLNDHLSMKLSLLMILLEARVNIPFPSFLHHWSITAVFLQYQIILQVDKINCFITVES